LVTIDDYRLSWSSTIYRFELYRKFSFYLDEFCCVWWMVLFPWMRICGCWWSRIQKRWGIINYQLHTIIMSPQKVRFKTDGCLFHATFLITRDLEYHHLTWLLMHIVPINVGVIRSQFQSFTILLMYLTNTWSNIRKLQWDLNTLNLNIYIFSICEITFIWFIVRWIIVCYLKVTQLC